MFLFLNGWGAEQSVWPWRQTERGCCYYDFGQGVNEAVQNFFIEHTAKERATLVGWSMGGLVALKLAALFPDKVERLVLLSSTARFTQTPGYDCGMPAVLVRNLARKVRRDPVQALTMFHKLMFVPGEEDECARFLRSSAIVQDRQGLLSGLEYLEKTDVRLQLEKIKQPVLLIHGTADSICPWEAAQYLHNHLAQSELISLNGAGHIPFFTRAQEYKKWIFGR
jgi:pimeloyl-[acyl-carrier protein] methyl ester esterase